MASRIMTVVTGIATLFVVFVAVYSIAFSFVAPASVPISRISAFGFLLGIVGGGVYVCALLFFLVLPTRTPNYVQYFLIVYAILAIFLSGLQIVMSAIENWTRGYMFKSDIVGISALVLSIIFVALLIIAQIRLKATPLRLQ